MPLVHTFVLSRHAPRFSPLPLGIYLPTEQTHIDIIEDFDQELITRLQELSRKHDFLIFEDRKFADIGDCGVVPDQTLSLLR